MVDLSPYLGVIVGASISAVVAFVAALITNRGHDRRLRIQLFNNEQKTAIAKLHQLVTESPKTTYEWIANIQAYLKTFEAQAFLSEEERSRALSMTFKVLGKMDELFPEDAEIDRMTAEQGEESMEDYLESLPPRDRAGWELDRFVERMKGETSAQLVGAVSKLATPKSPSRWVQFKRKIGQQKWLRRPKRTKPPKQQPT